MIRPLSTVAVILFGFLLLSACGSGGLSNKEQEAYASETAYAKELSDLSANGLAELIEISKRYVGVLLESYMSDFDEAKENMNRWTSYRFCLVEYKDIKEPYTKAKTACTARSGLNNDN